MVRLKRYEQDASSFCLSFPNKMYVKPKHYTERKYCGWNEEVEIRKCGMEEIQKYSIKLKSN